MQTIEQTKTPASQKTNLRTQKTNQRTKPGADDRRDQSGQPRLANRALPATSLYFAYGSNLNLDQMAVRCPTAQPLGPLTLPGWRLEFRSVADIVPCVGAEVAGALYRIEAGDELALDRYEGFRRSAPGQGLYRKVTRRLQDQSGHVEPFMFYVMNAAGGDFWPPQPSYLHTIRQGYTDWHLPTDTLEEAVLRSESAWNTARWTHADLEDEEAGWDALPTGREALEMDSLFGEDYTDV